MTSRRRKQNAPRKSAVNISEQDEADGQEPTSKRTRSSRLVSTRSQTQLVKMSTLKTKRSLKMKLKKKLRSKKVAKEKAAKAKMKEDQGKPADTPRNRVLNLDQIRKLSDVSLLKKFAEHKVDKAKKKSGDARADHIYTCKLLPDNCCQKFKGTDAVAKNEMKRHLLAHIGELLTLSATGKKATHQRSGSGASSSDEPEEKICEAQDGTRYMVPVLPRPIAIELPKSADVQGSSFTVIKSSEGLNEVVLLPKGQFINLTTMADNSDNSNPVAKGVLLADSVSSFRKDAVRASPHKERHVPNILRRSRRESPLKPKLDAGSGTSAEGRLTLSEFAQIVTEEVGLDDDRLAAAFHDDHNYTIVQKKPQIPELMNTDAEGRPIRPESSSQYIEMDSPPNYYEHGGAANECHNSQDGNAQQPQLQLGFRAKPTRIKMSEVVRNAKSEVEKSDEDAKSKQVRLKALEILKSMRKRRARLDYGNSKGQFECEICGKLYTAGATLTAHYRSHAGIKPFQCQVCKASFTRLHSLNYHMMIHNSQSRFTCDYCGRKFRHPSHFKEHLRRHTGEAPFACCDCPRRFKTRNTYKRHLRSKHGKVLTAKGITTMDGVPVVLVSAMGQAAMQMEQAAAEVQPEFDKDEEDDDNEGGEEVEEEEVDVDVEPRVGRLRDENDGQQALHRYESEVKFEP
ncbi:uncharacterized protein [Ptychodera flava]|uniref:uncharacterized protein isoform X2 n=1 Tax=Ptychodera flava TaxID=63121 RepID=UPI00396A2749